jgi:hypothetical protein
MLGSIGSEEFRPMAEPPRRVPTPPVVLADTVGDEKLRILAIRSCAW